MRAYEQVVVVTAAISIDEAGWADDGQGELQRPRRRLSARRQVDRSRRGGQSLGSRDVARRGPRPKDDEPLR